MSYLCLNAIFLYVLVFARCGILELRAMVGAGESGHTSDLDCWRPTGIAFDYIPTQARATLVDCQYAGISIDCCTKLL